MSAATDEYYEITRQTQGRNGMNHPGHEIVKCSKCDQIIMQCRCMDQNKPTRYMVCDDCRKRPEQLDRVSRAAEVAAASLIDLAKEIEKAYVKSGGRVWFSAEGIETAAEIVTWESDEGASNAEEI